MKRRSALIVIGFVVLMVVFAGIAYVIVWNKDPEAVESAGQLDDVKAKMKSLGLAVSREDLYPLPGTDPESGKMKLDRLSYEISQETRYLISDPHSMTKAIAVWKHFPADVDKLVEYSKSEYFGSPFPTNNPHLEQNGWDDGYNGKISIALDHIGLHRMQRGDYEQGLRLFAASLDVARMTERDLTLSGTTNAWYSQQHTISTMLKCAYLYCEDPEVIDQMSELIGEFHSVLRPASFHAGMSVLMLEDWQKEMVANLKSLSPLSESEVDGLNYETLNSPRFIPANLSNAYEGLVKIAEATSIAGDDVMAQAKAADEAIEELKSQNSDYDRALQYLLKVDDHQYYFACLQFHVRGAQLAFAMAKEFHATGKVPTDVEKFGDLAVDPFSGGLMQVHTFEGGFFLTTQRYTPVNHDNEHAAFQFENNNDNISFEDGVHLKIVTDALALNMAQ